MGLPEISGRNILDVATELTELSLSLNAAWVTEQRVKETLKTFEEVYSKLRDLVK